MSRKTLYSFGKLFWSIYFVLTIGLVGFVMAYVVGTLLNLIALIIRFLMPKVGEKVGIFAEYVQCYSIYFLLKIQPWLKFSENFQPIYNFYGIYKTRRVMVVCNHRSKLDTFILIGLIPGLRGMAKKTIFHNIFFAPIMLMIGFVPVEKGSLNSFREGLRLLREKILLRNRPALVFPETTRCQKHFAGIGKFSDAVFGAAIDSQSLVVPIVIENSDLIMGRGDILINPFHHANFKILDALDSRKFSTAHEMSIHVQNLLEKELQCS